MSLLPQSWPKCPLLMLLPCVSTPCPSTWTVPVSLTFFHFPLFSHFYAPISFFQLLQLLDLSLLTTAGIADTWFLFIDKERRDPGL